MNHLHCVFPGGDMEVNLLIIGMSCKYFGRLKVIKHQFGLSKGIFSAWGPEEAMHASLLRPSDHIKPIRQVKIAVSK